VVHGSEKGKWEKFIKGKKRDRTELVSIAWGIERTQNAEVRWICEANYKGLKENDRIIVVGHGAGEKSGAPVEDIAKALKGGGLPNKSITILYLSCVSARDSQAGKGVYRPNSSLIAQLSKLLAHEGYSKIIVLGGIASTFKAPCLGDRIFVLNPVYSDKFYRLKDHLNSITKPNSDQLNARLEKARDGYMRQMGTPPPIEQEAYEAASLSEENALKFMAYYLQNNLMLNENLKEGIRVYRNGVELGDEERFDIVTKAISR